MATALHRERYVTLDVTPALGGALMSRTSAEKAGIANYTQKLDFRRELDLEVRAEGHDYFWANESRDIGNQPFPAKMIAGEPITLIHSAIQPNGKRALIAATPTRIWRFFSFEDGIYVLGDANGIYVDGANDGPSGAFQSYFDENPSDWILIGRDFVPVGPNFDAIHSGLANGSQTTATDIVTASSDFFTTAMVGKQIRFNGGFKALIIGFTDATHATLNQKPPRDIGPEKFRIITGAHRWEAKNINGYVVFNNGADLPQVYRLEWSEVRPIYELRELGIARVGTVEDFNGILMCADITEIFSDRLAENFALQDSVGITATQPGSVYSGLVTGSQGIGVFTVAASAPFFDAGMIGKFLRYTNGFKSEITAFTNPTNVDVLMAPNNAVVGLPFWIVDENPVSGTYSFLVNSSLPAFIPEMIGVNIVWDDGSVRKIIDWVSVTQVAVDTDISVLNGPFSIERRFAYDAYVFPWVNRYQYRIIWALPGEPTRSGPSFKGSIGAGTSKLTLDNPQKSLVAGQQILIIGAGVSGGNLTTRIVYVGSLGKVLMLSDPADTSITSQPLTAADVIGSILGYEDLQDDGSGILRMQTLKRFLVIFRDTSVFTGRYTGIAEAPFEFDHPVPCDNHEGLHYRWTLANIQGEWLIYAGRNAFYRFDLTNLIPIEIRTLDLSWDIFFEQISIDMIDSIFAAVNSVTKQVLFVFPSETTDKALVYDYRYGTASTTSAEITGAATVKRPESGLSVGETEDWFVMGTALGVVLLCGRVDKKLAQWGNAKQIYYRRQDFPYSPVKLDYTCVLQSGLSHFGDQKDEKDVREFILYLASQMNGNPAPGILFELFGTRNLAEVKSLLASYLVLAPESQNLIPLFFRQHYLQSRISASGVDKACSISGWAWSVSGVRSNSNIRRP